MSRYGSADRGRTAHAGGDLNSEEVHSVIDRSPRLLLHAEGATVAVSAVALYFYADYPWLLLVALALAPDLSMTGYSAGPRIGAAAYNAAHTYVLPVAVAALGVMTNTDAPFRSP
jgi:uncharacterized protein DUF4260